MNSEKISVIMASFNGIKYIGEQLDSIRAQTRIPDEVIISDDCSTDGTFEFCRDYILQHKLTSWKIFQNEKNLGFAKNFRHAFTLSNLAHEKGSIIFTCDQDDIWLPDKIQVMSQAMSENPKITLLVSNYIPFNDNDGRKIQAHLTYSPCLKAGDSGLNKPCLPKQVLQVLLQWPMPQPCFIILQFYVYD